MLEDHLTEVRNKASYFATVNGVTVSAMDLIRQFHYSNYNFWSIILRRNYHNYREVHKHGLVSLQVSLLVPSLSQPSLADSAASESLSPDNVRVTRSVSDVLKAKGQPEQESSPTTTTTAANDNSKLTSNRKTKEERRLSNRQKLLSLKRHRQGCQMAKFDRFLSLDCARVEGVGAQSKERKRSNFAA